MIGIKFFHKPKPRQFDYRPRYYNKEQEAREQRKRELLGSDYEDKYKTEEEKKQDSEKYVPGVYIRRDMMARRGMSRSKKNNTVVVRRLVIMFLLLAVAVWWLLSSDFLQNFFEKWLAL